MAKTRKAKLAVKEVKPEAWDILHAIEAIESVFKVELEELRKRASNSLYIDAAPLESMMSALDNLDQAVFFYEQNHVK